MTLALLDMERLIDSIPKSGDEIAAGVVKDLKSAKNNLDRLSNKLIGGNTLELRDRPIDELLSRACLYDNLQHSQVKELVSTLNKLGLTLSFEKIVNKSKDLLTQTWVDSIQNSLEKETQDVFVSKILKFLVNEIPSIQKSVLGSLSPGQQNWVNSVKDWYDFLGQTKKVDINFSCAQKNIIRHISNAAGELGIIISKPYERADVYRSPS
ncbi:MAG: hypothetical protein EXS67_05230 [Candidatus Margulisbacteria bacterium]|nr:hypothetical protein [Candidatus Margulisiibacteriota bacterium]